MGPDANREQILAIVRELFSDETLTLDDDIFDLGAHSMLVIRLIARVRQELGLQVTAPQILADGTVRSIADLSIPVIVEEHQ